MSETDNPRYSAATAEYADDAISATSATTAFLPSRFKAT
jgi:hypothetical protein